MGGTQCLDAAWKQIKHYLRRGVAYRKGRQLNDLVMTAAKAQSWRLNAWRDSADAEAFSKTLAHTMSA